MPSRRASSPSKVGAAWCGAYNTDVLYAVLYVIQYITQYTSQTLCIVLPCSPSHSTLPDTSQQHPTPYIDTILLYLHTILDTHPPYSRNRRKRPACRPLPTPDEVCPEPLAELYSTLQHSTAFYSLYSSTALQPLHSTALRRRVAEPGRSRPPAPRPKALLGQLAHMPFDSLGGKTASRSRLGLKIPYSVSDGFSLSGGFSV